MQTIIVLLQTKRHKYDSKNLKQLNL